MGGSGKEGRRQEPREEEEQTLQLGGAYHVAPPPARAFTSRV